MSMFNNKVDINYQGEADYVKRDTKATDVCCGGGGDDGNGVAVIRIRERGRQGGISRN